MEKDGFPRELWIRTPVIPGATATAENIMGIGAFIGSVLQGAVSRWDLCAFNNLCRDKYRRLGLEWAFDRTELLQRAFMEEMAEAARQSGGGSVRRSLERRHPFEKIGKDTPISMVVRPLGWVATIYGILPEIGSPWPPGPGERVFHIAF